jgi:hypothetical protein
MSSEAFLVRRPCIGGQLSSRGPAGQERIEHFSGRICHYVRGSSLWAGPLLLNINAIGAECSRVLPPVSIE